MSENQSAFPLGVSLVTEALSNEVGVCSVSNALGRALCWALCSSPGSPHNGPPGVSQPPFEGGATFALPAVHFATLQMRDWSQGLGFIDLIQIQDINLPATSLGLSTL